MQRIKFKTYQPGALGKVVVNLFQDCSTNPLPYQWRGYPLEAGDLISTLMRGKPHTLAQCNLAMQPIGQPKEGDERVVVGFSGGKDSAAAALKLAGQGFAPTLFHVRGLNRAYPGEADAATAVARALGFKLAILNLTLSGKSAWIENPAKNQFILGMMGDYGWRQGIAHYCQGNLSEDHATDTDFGAGFSDAVEMYRAADTLMGAAIPGYAYHHGLLKNDSDSLTTILKLNPGILPSIQSCMTGPRFRGKLHQTNEAKFKVKLLPERCGSCYKCGVEWLHMALLGESRWIEGFAEHSVAQLMKWEERVRGKGNFTRRQAVTDFIDSGIVPGVDRLF